MVVFMGKMKVNEIKKKCTTEIEAVAFNLKTKIKKGFQF